ncbi:hypothetical protein BT93_K0832 [Corymbia citriodora subsp. variegata]|nr:hypothetical protein BT93_K0832 [Corymbia citriodora subsp. variegata]
MASGDSTVARRAWDVLRLALPWGRRGGAFRRLLAVKFRLAATRFIESIGGRYRGSITRDRICYGERQLSFDETPIFRVKMRRPGGSAGSRFRLPRIPCISPDVDFEYGFFDDGDKDSLWERKSLVVDRDGEQCGYDERAPGSWEEGGGRGGEGIDERAEEFIATFYEQMKLQRQISYLQYTEMLSRATS